MDGRLPCAHAQSFQSSLQRGDAPLQHCSGRVAEPTVAKSFDLETKQGRSMVGAIECIRDGLTDWNGYRVRRGMHVIAAVNHERVVSPVCLLGQTKQPGPSPPPPTRRPTGYAG